MKRKLKTIIIVCSLLLVCIIALYANFFIYGGPISTDKIGIRDIRIEDNMVKVSGDDIQDSALAFSGYRANIQGERLIITLHYSLVSLFHKSGSFEITYNTRGRTVEEVYIKGMDKDDIKQIWPASTN